MSVDRSIRFAPPPFSYKNACHPSITCPSHSHRSDGPAQYQFMPHSHPTPPPIATLHHSPALSASSLESTSISPSPPVGTLFLLSIPSTPYYPHPAHAPPMSQAPPYPYQPNGAMSRYPDDSQPGYPPHPASARNIRPTMVAAQPYPGQANYIIHTDDASTKLSDRVRRKCYNCRTTDTSTWRRSSLTPGKVLCNKCGLFERTHSRPRPEQFPHKRGPVVNVNQFKQHRNTPPPPSHAAQAAAAAALAQQQPPRRLPSMSADMLPPHHYSHPSLSPLMAARSSDAQHQQQQYRSGGVTEIGALLNGGGEAQAAASSAGGSPHQSPHQVPHGVKRSGSPLEQPQHAHPPPGGVEAQASGSPAVSAGSIPSSPRNERREVTYRASN
ncbi:hypothetical protein LXA43DRAFT_900395 [Ganoderma leucocontextum]|nr:hypothetical protein LXA43DRAFT_900395 [Ganoderma leucocontextum]